MPTYQYACTECGEQLEVVQKFSDEPLTVCPACQGRLRKVFSAVGVVFKGSGFYKTDSRSGSKSGSSSTAAKSESSKTEGSAAGDSASSTSTSKPDSGASGSGKNSGSSGDGSKVA